MAYNTGLEKWKSDELAGLDCGYGLRSNPINPNMRFGTITFSSTKVLGVGECASMVRVYKGESVQAAELYWAAPSASTCVPTTVLAVGDPYCCGRILGPVNTLYRRGEYNPANSTIYADCSTLTKMGIAADGCGIGYTYTCDTDIVLTNLYNDGFAYVGGSPSAYTVGTKAGAALSSGKFILILTVRPPVG